MTDNLLFFDFISNSRYITSLGVPANHKVYGCVALGYADSKIPMKEKKVKADTVTIVK